MDNERDHSKFIIQRFDNYLNAANTKGNFLLAFNIFLCGGVIANYNNLKSLIAANNLSYLNIALCALFIIGLVVTGFIMATVFPFLRSGNSSKDKYHSLVFFKSIAEFDNEAEFLKAYKEQENQNVEEDLAKQAYHLSIGLKAKYNKMAMAMRLVFVELILLLIILGIIIFL